MSIPLPNDKWLRSSKMPNWALCFDSSSPYFLHKMCEDFASGTWIKSDVLTQEELSDLIDMVDPLLDPFKPVVREHLAMVVTT